MSWRLSRILAVATVVGLCPLLAWAVITAPTSLKAYIATNKNIVMAKVDKLYPEKPAVVLTVEEDLKGKLPYRRLAVRFEGDSDAKKLEHTPQLLKRLAPGLPVVLFMNPFGKKIPTFAYTNGTWFQLRGHAEEPGMARWELLHGEPYLRKAFKGTTEEMRKVVVDAVSGKAEPPEINEKEPPGFGPEAAPAKSGARGTGGPLFGVIPTLGVGAPLAILALLFPAVFGGVLVLFRQWTAFLTILSINSMLLLIRGLLAASIEWGWMTTATLRSPSLAWLFDDGVLWTIMTVVTALGILWCWRRQLTALSFGSPLIDVPRRTELMVLSILSATCVVMVAGMYAVAQPDFSDLAWGLTVTLSLGVVAATLYRLARPTGGLNLPLSTEGVMLGVALVAHVAIASLRWGGAAAVAGGTIDAPTTSTAATGLGVPELIGRRWVFPAKEAGVFVSTAYVDGDKVYAAAAHPAFKGGSVYCLDRRTGKEVWSFIDDGDMKEMLSSPTVADGRLYIGEGFHDDPNCKLYCLDAATGNKLWEFQTTSQTESSPKVEAGKVYFGGGNDGFYCLDAVTGKKVWQYPATPGGRLMRFGAAPLVFGDRVFCGTGVDRNKKDDPGETAIVSLDAATGKEVWKVPTSLPCWGAPVMKGSSLFVTLGNGDIFTDAPSPAGKVLCLSAATGRERWHYDLPNGVLEAPAVDADHVYVGCRDGHVYCLGRYDGALRWKTPLGSPVIATPALAPCPGYDATAHVFAAATAGKVFCLHPHTGAIQWTYTVSTGEKAHVSSSPRVVASRTTGGDQRHIIFGAGVGDLASGRAVLYCLEDVVRVQ